jgi:hypothetical protein
MQWQIDFLTPSPQAHHIYGAIQLLFVEMIPQDPGASYMNYECAFYYAHLIRLFWDFLLKLSTGFCLLVSSLHEAGSFLLFFLAASGFLLPFLKSLTCHKNSFLVMGAPFTALYPAHLPFFLPARFFAS